MKSAHFDTIDIIKDTSTRLLNSIPADEFQGAFRAWQNRWQRCIDAEGDYFEEF